MTSPSNSIGDNHARYSPSEFHAGSPWVLEMDDAQRKAHAKQMEASANKTQAEADDIKGRSHWSKFWLGLSYFFAYGVTLVVGIVLGATLW